MTCLYLVVRRTWYDNYSGLEIRESGEGGTVLESFSVRARAEALCRRLEVEVREQVASPFLIAEDLWALTTLEEETFIERIRALGLPPPEGRPYHGYVIRDWTHWYDEIVDQVTSEQREGLWELLDRVRFYQVREIRLIDSAMDSLSGE